MKTCRVCHEEKLLTLFVKNKNYKYGYETLCKECSSIRSKIWRKNATKKPCGASPCKNMIFNGEYCKTHRERLKKYGSVLADVPTYAGNIFTESQGWTNQQGYRIVPANGHPNAWKNGNIFEHTLVMANYLGRALLSEENVHHKNGQRSDNTIANLELWSKSQPYGQRVEDKVQWAKELLALYEPEALC